MRQAPTHAYTKDMHLLADSEGVKLNRAEPCQHDEPRQTVAYLSNHQQKRPKQRGKHRGRGSFPARRACRVTSDFVFRGNVATVSGPVYFTPTTQKQPGLG